MHDRTPEPPFPVAPPVDGTERRIRWQGNRESR